MYLDSGALIVYLDSGALIVCLDSGALQTDLVRRHLPDSAFSLSQLNRLSRGLILVARLSLFPVIVIVLVIVIDNF